MQDFLDYVKQHATKPLTTIASGEGKKKKKSKKNEEL